MPSTPRKRRQKRRSKLNRMFRRCLTFIFSHVGLAIISVMYMVAGTVVFKFLEAPHETTNRALMELSRRRLRHESWLTIRDNHTAIDRSLLIESLYRRLSKFKFLTIGAIKRGYDGRPQLDNIQWSYPGSFFYSMTTISTVGYGNIAPRTTLGRVVTIGYAIFGIPLMLLFLTIMGDTFSITCKFLYRSFVRHRIRFLRWRFKRRQEARFNSTLGRLIRQQLYHTAAMYGIEPTEAPIDSNLLAEGEQSVKSVSVPLYILITLMIAYLVAGSTLFCLWEDWTFDEGFYFCFISLALIGFGDLFPGGSVIESWAARTRIIICAFYLLFGMALIAMCFNLAQDNVVKKFQNYVLRFGLSKSDRRGSKSIDPSDVIVEGGPIGGPNEAQPLTVRDIQRPLLQSTKFVIPFYYGSTSKTLRQGNTNSLQKAKILISNGTLSLLSNTKSTRPDQKGRRYAFDSNSTRTYFALTKRAYILEARRSF